MVGIGNGTIPSQRHVDALMDDGAAAEPAPPMTHPVSWNHR
jgi:hypothetical protein